MGENLAATLRLLLVTDDAFLRGGDVLAACQAAVRGGVTAVQLRLKHAADAALADWARRMVAELAVPVFVNDRVDVALAVGAAGAHLGPDDLSPLLARAIAPPGFIIGASVGSVSEIVRGDPADYWGIGPLRATATKLDAGAPLGVDGASRLLARASGRPCVVIGGVRPEDVKPARIAGFAGVAVASGILADADIEAAARRYAEP
jgi:thiamine-phosphate pyrophosphorylase